MKNRRTGDPRRLNLVAAAVAACFSSSLAVANPTGPAVANGQVTFHQQGNLLQITNSPNAIINWQSFSIGASEITRFLQQSASSAVLNRVITQNPSAIFGALQSNGRVFLINPSGILFGPGSQVDVAGLVASTLNLSDQDFLAGRLRFTEVPGAGSVINQGAISTVSGGQVYLVGPAVKNEGVITSPNGEVVLAAGNTVELVEPGTPNLRVEITAPDNEAVNLGQIAADAGRVGIYAGLINQSGTVQANTAQVTEDGRIILKATKGVNLEAGSVTAASGVKGGNVTVETETGTIRVAGEINASGDEAGGSINLAVTGASGGIDLAQGLHAGNASVNLDGPGNTTVLTGDVVTNGTPIFIGDSVVLGEAGNDPGSVTLDTTGGGAFAGSSVTITGTVDDDVAGSTALTLNGPGGGINTVGGAIGGTTPIAGFTTNGFATSLQGGLVATTGDQTYNGQVTLTAPTTLTTDPGGTVYVNQFLSSFGNSLTVDAGSVVIGGFVSSGIQSISTSGDILVGTGSGPAVLGASGPQTITAGGGLIVESSPFGGAQVSAFGGQSIDAHHVEVKAKGSEAFILNSGAGHQTITTDGANWQGEGVAVHSQGGLAVIDQDAFGFAQSITANNANYVRVIGESGPARIEGSFGGGAQMLTLQGTGMNALVVGGDSAADESRIAGGNQTITAGQSNELGSISVRGSLMGFSSPSIGNFQGSQTITTSGAVKVEGGSSPFSSSAFISNDDLGGIQVVTANSLVLHGGESGVGNGAVVTSAGNQQLNIGAGGIELLGGADGSNNRAELFAFGFGPQQINTSAMTVQGGAAGFGNTALVHSNGSQQINAGSGGLLVKGGNGSNNTAQVVQQDPFSDQAFTVTAGDLVVAGGDMGNGNGASLISSGTQNLSVVGGNVSVLGGADGFDNSAGLAAFGFGGQHLQADGMIVRGGDAGFGNIAILDSFGPQNIQAGTSGITVMGGAAGANNIAAMFANAGGNQSVTTNGGNIIVAGGAGSGNIADIRQRNGGSSQFITVNGGGALSLQGGSDGEGNFARIRNDGVNQNFDFTSGGTLTLTGGSGVRGNFAQINANNGSQSITGAPTIELTGGTGGVADDGNRAQLRARIGTQTINANALTITGGADGVSNGANVQAPVQNIIVAGDLTLEGRGSASGASQGGSARLGGPGGGALAPTNLTLDVGGNVTLRGGDVATAFIGSATLGGTAPNNIAMMVGGNVTLDPGAGTSARIGASGGSPTGGNISVAAGGNIALNSSNGIGTAIRTLDDVSLDANAITQGKESTVVANQLMVNVNTGADLSGANQVTSFTATGGFPDGVTLNNSSPLLTAHGIDTFGGPLMLSQTGDLTLTGLIFSGPQTISATGNILVVPNSPTFISSFGPQSITAGGGLVVQSSPGGSADVSAQGGQTINAAFVEVTAQGNTSASITNIFSGDQNITVSGGGSSPGIDVQVLASGGSASISNLADGASQTIVVTDADHINVNGFGPGSVNVSAGIEVPTGTQTISITGNGANAINVGSAGALSGSVINARSQSITAGTNGENGSITIVGPGIDGASAFISTQGGSPGAQALYTSGALTLLGGDAAQAFSSGLFHNASGPQTVTAADITLVGGSSGRGNGVEIRAQTGDQVITVTGGGALTLQGGGGTDNFARIRANNGNQLINVAGGAIVITGGDGPDVAFPTDTANNFARIETRAPAGIQTVIADAITITGGAAGANNFAGIQAAHQQLDTTGNVTLLGGGDEVGSGARIGAVGSLSDTDVKMNVGGNLELNGGAGSGAAIGSNSDGGRNTGIVVNAAGHITLNPGSGAGARIGSPLENPGGGDIMLTSAGNIALNSGGGQRTVIRTLDDVSLKANTITQGADARILANQLTTETNAGTSLGGDNQVAVFDATNGTVGGVLLRNASPLLTITGVSTIPGSFTLLQDGDLAIVGDIWSGPQFINVSGDMIVGADANSVILYADGPRHGMAKGEPHASFKALGVGLLDRLAGHSPVNISARSLTVQGGSASGSFSGITGGPVHITTTGDRYTGDFNLSGGSGFGAFGWVLSSQDVNLNVGGNLNLNAGSGLLSFARIQTVRPTSKIRIYFPNLSSGGYFLNGVEGARRSGLSGFFTGPQAAKPGKGLLVDYGM